MFDLATIATSGLAGITLATAVLWYWARSGYARGIADGVTERARLEERLIQQERRMEEAEAQLTQKLESVSNSALRKNNESFIHLAKATLDKYQQGARDDLSQRQKSIEQLTQPIRERLEKFDGKLDELEKSRVGAYRALDQQLKSLLETHLPRLHSETANLVKALRQPTTRGRWGEMQLRRVVEMAGMLEHCDFTEQESVTTEAGRLRPDMIVRLPGGRNVVVDSKAPVDAYLTAIETNDDAAKELALAQHARQVRDHINALGKKSYHDQFDPTPEFVVMFIPGEAFFSAALTQDIHLIEHGVEQRVIPASPTTLIALLRAIAYGWRQEALAENAAEVAALGRELYDRIQSLAGHWRDVGRRLDQSVESYNKSVGALESRVLVSARRFQNLRAAPDGNEIDEPASIDRTARMLVAPEMIADESAAMEAEADRD